MASLEKLAVLEDSVHNTSRDVKSIMSNAMETAAKVDALASIQQGRVCPTAKMTYTNIVFLQMNVFRKSMTGYRQ